jgi:hypothetical protein
MYKLSKIKNYVQGNKKILGEETFQMFPINMQHQHFTLHIFEHIRIIIQDLFNDV